MIVEMSHMTTRISCKHMVPCMKHKTIEIEDFFHTYYIVGTFRKTYFVVTHPLLEVVLNLRDVIVLPLNLKSNVS